MRSEVDDGGWEWRVDTWWVGCWWLVAQHGVLERIGWRPTRGMAERKARAVRELLR